MNETETEAYIEKIERERTAWYDKWVVSEIERLRTERTRSMSTVDGMDYREGHARDNAMPDTLRDIVLGLAMKNERLRDALQEARDLVAEWGAYASEYFQTKWDLKGDIAKLDAILKGHERAARDRT